MMRELKFRQFVNGRWHYFGFIDNTFIGPITPDVENNPVVQFTGLKDLNFREIYEGDIVQVLDADMKINSHDSDTGYGAIEWLDCMGGWYIDRIHNSMMDINSAYYIEVIGNIFENPELIEVKCIKCKSTDIERVCETNAPLMLTYGLSNDKD